MSLRGSWQFLDCEQELSIEQLFIRTCAHVCMRVVLCSCKKEKITSASWNILLRFCTFRVFSSTLIPSLSSFVSDTFFAIFFFFY